MQFSFNCPKTWSSTTIVAILKMLRYVVFATTLTGTKLPCTVFGIFKIIYRPALICCVEVGFPLEDGNESPFVCLSINIIQHGIAMQHGKVMVCLRHLGNLGLLGSVKKWLSKEGAS